LIAPPKNFIAKPKRAGKKKKGCGESEFLPACSTARSAAWGGSDGAFRVKRKGKTENFSSLKEKSKNGARKK